MHTVLHTQCNVTHSTNLRKMSLNFCLRAGRFILDTEATISLSHIVFEGNSGISKNNVTFLRNVLLNSELSQFYFTPGSGVKYCHQHVCLFVCLSAQISQRHLVGFSRFPGLTNVTNRQTHRQTDRYSVCSNKPLSQTAKLRKTVVYDTPCARTNKFKNSFLLYALNNYV